MSSLPWLDDLEVMMSDLNEAIAQCFYGQNRSIAEVYWPIGRSAGQNKTSLYTIETRHEKTASSLIPIKTLFLL
jgi:hypothetical protein